MDCKIEDLLHEPKQRLVTTIDSFVTPENVISVKRLQINLDVLHNVVEHHYQLLVDKSTAPQHKIKLALGHVETTSESKCSLYEVKIRFFKEELTTALGVIINTHHDSIIEHSLHKVLLHVGHALRCKSQNLRTS